MLRPLPSTATYLVTVISIGFALLATDCARSEETKNKIDVPLHDFSTIPVNTWVKLSPLGNMPVSPRLGYEGACVWDIRQQVMIRYGGHNQGGGGEQNAEIWTFDPRSAVWQLKQPNTSPPGICCGQQNVYDTIAQRYIRFPAFSASHGWQWWREVYLNDSSVWTYDLQANQWRNIRPLPAANPRPLRCASWDAEHQVVVMFGGEGSNEGTQVYDPATNTWTAMRPKLEPAARSGGNMAYDARNKVHVLFGAQFLDDPHTWAYDLRSNTWRDMQPPAMPPTEKNDAVLTYDSTAGAVVALVKITTGKDALAQHRLETWTYDYAKNRWTRMNPEREPDPTSNRARQLMFAPDLGVTLLENRPSSSSGLSEQQVWAYRMPTEVPAANAMLQPPNDVKVETRPAGALLTWTSPPSDRVAALVIYRGAGEHPWQIDYQKLATVDAKISRYEDSGLTPGRAYYYYISAVEQGGNTSPPSRKISTAPRIVEDLVVSAESIDRCELRWQASPAEDIAGYHVDRAVVEVLSEDQLKRLKAQTPPLEQPSVGAIRRVGPFIRLTQSPTTLTEYVDTQVAFNMPAVVEGQPTYERSFNAEQFEAEGRGYRYAVYAYQVRTVNALGVVGGPSPAVLSIPAIPQAVFSKEEGTTCHLRWSANPEQGLRGYRVYRMDSRYGKDLIVRLTPEPIQETQFTDPNAGKSARRYHIVAVDALGQEGFPSSPVWFNREWQSFYKPFAAEWHQ